jgi:hypothetical protein
VEELMPSYTDELIARMVNAFSQKTTEYMNLYKMLFEVYYNVDHVVEELWSKHGVFEVVFSALRERVNRYSIRTAQYGTMETLAEANEAKMQFLLWVMESTGDPGADPIMRDLPWEIYHHMISYASEVGLPKGIVLLCISENFESWIRTRVTEGSVQPNFTVLPEKLSAWIGPELEAVNAANERILSMAVERRQREYSPPEGVFGGNIKEADYDRRIEEMSQLLKIFTEIQSFLESHSPEAFFDTIGERAALAEGMEMIEAIQAYDILPYSKIVVEMAGFIQSLLTEHTLTRTKIHFILKGMMRRNVDLMSQAIGHIQDAQARIEASIREGSPSGKKRRRSYGRMMKRSGSSIVFTLAAECMRGPLHPSIVKYIVSHPEDQPSTKEKGSKEPQRLFF